MRQSTQSLALSEAFLVPTKVDRASARGGHLDPVLDEIRAWLSDKDAQDALQREWQDAESRLLLTMKPLGMSLTQAIRARHPEAVRMRTLMKQIRALDRRLARAADRIVKMRPTTPRGALAKIEMALRIQEPQGCEEYSWALVEGGFARLCELI
jgi:hypothetical protein